jgi:multidrug resistance efflux pump
VRRLEVAQATRVEARSQEKAAEADLRKAQEAAGESGDDNAQLRSARSAIEKAELDLARTRVVAPGAGPVTDLRTDVGHFRPGRRAGDDADRDPRPLDQRRHDREQPRQHRPRRRSGDRPRRAARRSVEGPRAQRRQRRQLRPAGAPGALPTIENSRDWLRQAQRFPVAVEFDAAEAERLGKVRIGGQAEVLVYTGDNFR